MLNTFIVAEEEPEKNKTAQEHFKKIKRWCSEALSALPAAKKHSASIRIANLLNKEFHTHLHEVTVEDDSVSLEDTYTAWSFGAYSILQEAMCAAQDITRGKKEWRYLNQTMTTLVMGWVKKYPNGETLGHDAYMATNTV